MNIHDSRVTSYFIDLDQTRIEMHIEDEQQRKGSVIFERMCAYNFEHSLHASILLGIEKSSLNSFFFENEQFLKEKKDYYWPINYSEENQLKAYLDDNNFQYYKIQSSYGLSGWIVCQSINIIEKLD